jgi:hypothetical protein
VKINESWKWCKLLVLTASLKRGLISSVMLESSKMIGLILIQGKAGANSFL